MVSSGLKRRFINRESRFSPLSLPPYSWFLVIKKSIIKEDLLGLLAIAVAHRDFFLFFFKPRDSSVLL